jgi:hypothetical protein
MALQMASSSDLRRYNPDRDMLWALHRFFRRAFVQFGDGSDGKIAELMTAHRIRVPTCDLAENMKDFVKEIVAVVSDPTLKDTKNPAEKAEELLFQLFRDDNDGHTSIRTLFCVLFLKGLVCELPLWAAMTRPKHPNDPIPGNEDIEAAGREFLDKLGSRGDTAHG